jgi:glycosyltransferase involved in cell wall biosynthesis
MTDLVPLNGHAEQPLAMPLAAGAVRIRGANTPESVDGFHATRNRREASSPTVSLVIPVRNEARNIAWVLEQVADEVHEIILVDGNSTDATVITARSYRPDVKVVRQEGAGKGSALREGFLAASGDIIVMMDADGSMAPQEIRHYLHFLANGYDFVKGSRFIVGGGSLDITTFRRMGNWFLLTVFNTLHGTELTDLCYGFCAFHRCYLDHLSLSATGFEIEAEMVVSAMRSGLRIAEVPSMEMPRRSGKSNLHAIRDGVRVLRTLLDGHGPNVSTGVRQHRGRRELVESSIRASSADTDDAPNGMNHI